ncbi:InlB B-repeat-containing protein [Evansella cellulosilytica]|uniref:Putative Gly-rich membrane protein Bcell_0380 n=1 Tax=Evansella cellulosilytica (strain ATCC 21833 / DSM 2522 / FERM P-1141 / JCM 9156 / N-4) TaxID=649639 RepID=Y380_EVAC2|nr:InlB B-repeat-containing protein [Evansella cellulosilytica]P0DJ97.1 RecName: Full=Putative Gly-rich membrane protein Bcell_0380 [Evansella cellulosilytica DSM 2522]
MKRIRHITFLAAFICIIFVIYAIYHSVGQADSSVFAGGEGTKENPYLIETAAHLDNVRNYLGEGYHFQLVQDIDLTAYLDPGGPGWEPIGDNANRFEGHINGNGYRITGFFINRTDGNYIGLFGVIGENGLVRNLSLTGDYITVEGAPALVGALTGNNYGVIDNVSVEIGDGITLSPQSAYVGGLVGTNHGEIWNSNVNSDVNGGNEVGGLVGRNASNNTTRIGIIHNSHATGNVSGQDMVGGLVGNASGKIRYSYATGNVDGLESVGGLIGTSVRIEVDASYATSDVTGESSVGGLIGDVRIDNSRSSVRNSFAIGKVTLPSTGGDVGGLIGTNFSGDVENSYAAGQIEASGASNVGGLIGRQAGGFSSGTVENSFYDEDTTGQSDTGKGTPMSTADMKDRSTFEDAGWDFDWIWGIESDDYPHHDLYFTLTYQADDLDHGDVPSDEIHSRGSVVLVADQGNMSRTGYSFSGWNTALDGSGETYDPYSPVFNSFVMGANDKTLYAQWSINKYDVHFDGNDYDSGQAPLTETILYESEVNVPDQHTLVKDGYTFTGWNTERDGSGDFYEPGDTFRMGTEPVTLYAQWEINVYSVSFESNGGSQVSEVEAEYGTAITEPLPPEKEGHLFKGWYQDELLTEAWDFETSKVSENMILYAKWEINEYTVSFESNGGSQVSEVEAEYGSSITEPVPPEKEGHSFKGWYQDEFLTEAWDFKTDTVSGDMTLYAKWEINVYSVSFESNGGSQVSEVDTEFASLIEEPTPPEKEGHSFKGWYQDKLLTEAWEFETDTVIGDMTLYAKWEINVYTVSFATNGGSKVSEVDAEFASLIAEPTPPEKEGHSFKEWYQDELLTEAWEFERTRLTKI